MTDEAVQVVAAACSALTTLDVGHLPLLTVRLIVDVVGVDGVGVGVGGVGVGVGVGAGGGAGGGVGG